ATLEGGAATGAASIATGAAKMGAVMSAVTLEALLGYMLGKSTIDAVDNHVAPGWQNQVGNPNITEAQNPTAYVPNLPGAPGLHTPGSTIDPRYRKHSKGGVVGYAGGTGAVDPFSQPLLNQPDTGGDSILGMLNGQPVGLRGGEGILTPEAVSAL